MFSQLAIAVLASFAYAAPTTTTGFSVGQVEAGDVLISGPQALAKAYLKYNVTVPPATPAGVVVALQSGSVTAAPEQYDKSYLSPVQIGTPPQTLMMDFDTGSSDLWVFSSLQPASQTSGHTAFQIGKSSTAQRKAGETWKISYADNSGSSGVVYGDKVNIGGVTATQQAVECATSASSSFVTDKKNDGLVGLGGESRNTASPKTVTPFFKHVAPTLPQKLFTALLKHSEPGSYDFGFINPNKYSGSIAYTPIKRTSAGAGLYQFVADGYTVKKKHYSANIEAIADTGTSLILVPQTVASHYYSAVAGAVYNSQVGGYIFPCASSLPAFQISIGGAKHSVPGKFINYVKVGSIDSEEHCYGGIQQNTGLPFAIFGDVFLKSVFAVFDVGNQRLGFAPQK